MEGERALKFRILPDIDPLSLTFLLRYLAVSYKHPLSKMRQYHGLFYRPLVYRVLAKKPLVSRPLVSEGHLVNREVFLLKTTLESRGQTTR